MKWVKAALILNLLLLSPACPLSEVRHLKPHKGGVKMHKTMIHHQRRTVMVDYVQNFSPTAPGHSLGIGHILCYRP
ncbi:hypothetical protein AMTRI_Chr04g186120 [Amborella trichopoda]